MGKTAFSGPAYGAKATLFSVRVGDASSGVLSTTITLSAMIIPTGEDWYATEMIYSRSSTGSTGVRLQIFDDSTLVVSTSINSSLGDQNGFVTITPDPGEYEGARLVSGSTIAFVLGQSSVAQPTTGITMTLRGFTRFVNSTRSE